MNRLRQYFEHLAQLYPDPLDYYRVRMVLIISLVILVGVLIAQSGILYSQGFDFGNTVVVGSLLGFFLLLTAIAATHVFIRRGQSLPGRLLIMMMGAVVAFTIILYFGLYNISALFLMMMPLLASALFGARGTFGGTGLAFGITGFYLIAEAQGYLPSSGMGQTRALILLGISGGLLSVSTILLWFFTGSVQHILWQSQQSSQQLQTITEIGQVANSTLDNEQLLPELVEMIRRQMSFYHVQIFLVDTDTNLAILTASTGRSGQQLLARGHSLGVGSRSVIGQATGRGTVVYATDTSLDPVHHANEFLPATRSEIALPLFDNAQVIGALDVQSVRPNAFSTADIATLEIMANQIAIAIINARLFKHYQTSLEEKQALYEASERTLQEVERLNRQLTAQAWTEYLSDEQRDYGVQLDGSAVHRQTDWTPALQAAIHNAASVVQSAGEQATIAVPLDVRGQVLGAIEVTLPPNAQREEAQDLVEAVANRLGLTLDNTRLFEEARTLAQQEHVINEIGGRLQEASEVDDMLQVALLELRQVLNAESGAIRLRADVNLAGVDSDIG